MQQFGASAFSQCGLKAIKVPKSVDVLCQLCCAWCEFLAKVTFEAPSQVVRLK
jgi:hypothetical protein